MLWGVATCICRCARHTRTVALVPDCARSAAEASVRGDRCRQTGVGGGPYRCCSRWNMVWCRVHPLTRCNCGASGAARGAYFAIEIYMNLYYLITVVNKNIVFLNKYFLSSFGSMSCGMIQN